MTGGVLFLFLVAVTAHVDAQDAVPVREEIIRVSERSPGLRKPGHIGQTISLLSGRELERRRSYVLGEILDDLPGISMDSFGPAIGHPIIRGLRRERILVLENGLSTMDLSSGADDHPFAMDPLSSNRIEILRGVAALPYGGDALGGVINVVNDRIPVRLLESASRLHYGFGSNGYSGTGAFKRSGSYRNLAYNIDGLVRDAKAYRAADDMDVPDTQYRNGHINMGLSYFLDMGYVGFSMSRLNSRYAVAGHHHHGEEEHEHEEHGEHEHEEHGEEEEHHEEEGDEYIGSQQTRYDLAAYIRHPDFFIQSTRIRVANGDYYYTEGVSRIDNKEWESMLEWAHRPVGSMRGTFGVRFNVRDLKARSVTEEPSWLPPVADAHTVSLFLLEGFDLGSVNLDLGVRVDNERREARGVRVTDTIYGFSGDLHWDLTEKYFVGLGVGRAQRMPSIEELFSAGDHTSLRVNETGQSDLRPETANNLELFIGSDETQASAWRLGSFVSYIEEYIYLKDVDHDDDGMADMSSGEFAAAEYRQDDAIFYGVELDVRRPLHMASDWSLHGRVFADYVRGRIDGGANLPRISPPRIGLSLEHSWRRLDVTLDVMHRFRQTEVAPLETETSGWNTVDLRADYNFHRPGSPGAKLYVQVRNLLDRFGRMHESRIKEDTPIRGRRFDVGLTIDF